MAAVAHVFTLAYVAALLGEGEDWLHEISIEMEPEDGLIGVYGVGDEYTPAFTDFGIENLHQLIEIHRQDAARAEAAAMKPKPGP
jgi:hypothetical protein